MCVLYMSDRNVEFDIDNTVKENFVSFFKEKIIYD